MNASEICASISPSLPALFQCEAAPREGVRVRTPLLFPDGGIVDVFVVAKKNGYVVTDYGDALGWLGQHSVSNRLSKNQQSMVKDVCQTLRLELTQGQLTRSKVRLNDLAVAVVEVAQAVVRVSDIWFTMRSRSTQPTAEAVDKWLRTKSIRFARDVQIQGRSRRWRIDFETQAYGQTSLVRLLTTRAKGATRRMVEHAVAGWVDMRNLRESERGLTLVSLFDDTKDVWSESDFRQLEIHSEIAKWSQREQFNRILTMG